MFKKKPPSAPRVLPAGVGREGLEPSDAAGATMPQFRVIQHVPISPAALESAIDRCNAYCDSELYLKPMWDLGISSGGGLNCTMRNGKAVIGRASLRVLFDFDKWNAQSPGLSARPVSSRQAGPLASRLASRRRPCHRLRFESATGTRRWSLKHMVLVTAMLCALLGWEPVGGLGIRAVQKQIQRVQQVTGHAVRHRPYPRNPVTRSAPAAPTLPSALCAPPSASEKGAR